MTLVRLTEDPDDRDAHRNPALIRAETVITCCRFRLVSSTETTHPGNRVTEVWKLTAPPHPDLLTASNRDKIEYGGVAYGIQGTPRAVRDMNGAVHHLSITCTRSLG